MKHLFTITLLCLFALCATAELKNVEVSSSIRIPIGPDSNFIPSTQSTLADQTEVSVTAYNSDLALVREIRKVSLPEGAVHLTFQDVAEQIRPETVSLRSLTDASSITLFEQNYEYDLISPGKLMEKYVGKPVRLVNLDNKLNFVEVNATLLSNNEGPVYQIGNDIYLGHPGNVVLPEIPENLIATPSLIWRLENTAPEQQLEVTYLTGGVSWHADYVVTIPRDASALDLAGWVTMDNQSGATYTDATLKLVAGDVNIAAPQIEEQFQALGYMAKSARSEVMPQEESFSEYHLYTMPCKTTIKQNQSKQLALLDVVGVTFTRKYEYRAEQYWFFQPTPPMKEQHVGVYLEFENEEANQMGLPLPAGVIRIYEEDSSGALQFSGEDRIQHTPKDETVTLKMGTAFDVIAEHTQTDFQQLAPNVYESAYEIILRNHKETDIVVDVKEPMTADWEILEKSMEFEKEDAITAVFHVPVPADGEVTVTYRVRVTQ